MAYFLIGLQRANFRPSMRRNLRGPTQYDKFQKMKANQLALLGRMFVRSVRGKIKQKYVFKEKMDVFLILF